MAERVHLTGRYRIIDRAFLTEKASRDDPRHIFYLAMLANNTYEGYLAEVGQKEVHAKTYQTGPVNGRMEILYARRRRWLSDNPDSN